MARTKAIVRRLPQVVIPQRVGNKNILNRRIRNIPFTIKQIVPQPKRVDVKRKKGAGSLTNER